MAIRRIKIELDDRADDVNNQTDIPQELKHEKTLPSKHDVKTGERPPQEDDVASEDTQEVKPKASSKKEIGRTHSDLFLEIKEDARCMVTFFILISFIIFSFQLGKLGLTTYLGYVFMTGIILNVVWFVVPVIIGLFKKPSPS